MGIEPTGTTSRAAPTGFEDQARHQPRSAPVDRNARATLRLHGPPARVAARGATDRATRAAGTRRRRGSLCLPSAGGRRRPRSHGRTRIGACRVVGRLRETASEAHGDAGVMRGVQDMPPGASSSAPRSGALRSPRGCLRTPSSSVGASSPRNAHDPAHARGRRDHARHARSVRARARHHGSARRHARRAAAGAAAHLLAWRVRPVRRTRTRCSPSRGRGDPAPPTSALMASWWHHRMEPSTAEKGRRHGLHRAAPRGDRAGVPLTTSTLARDALHARAGRCRRSAVSSLCELRACAHGSNRGLTELARDESLRAPGSAMEPPP